MKRPPNRKQSYIGLRDRYRRNFNNPFHVFEDSLFNPAQWRQILMCTMLPFTVTTNATTVKPKVIYHDSAQGEEKFHQLCDVSKDGLFNGVKI